MVFGIEAGLEDLRRAQAASTPPTRPLPLDSAITAPCAEVPKPESPDYDVWQVWAMDPVRQYADCAARHAKTI